MGCVLCMQIEKLKCFRTNGSEEVGGCTAERAQWHQFHPENADSGGRFATRSMDVIGRPSIAALTLLLMSFFSSIWRGTALIDNLVSCPLILKDVRLYNKVKRRAPRFFFVNVKASAGMRDHLQFCLQSS